MEQELHKIILVPGRCIEKRLDGYVVRCLISDNHVEDRKFNSCSLEGMVNPNLLMMGIMTGVGYSQINFIQADEFQKLFEKHWKEVL